MYNFVCNLDTLQALGISEIFAQQLFTALIIKTTETTVLKKNNKVAMLLFKILISSPGFIVLHQKLLVWDKCCTQENLKNLKTCRNLYVRYNDMVTLMVVSAQLDMRCVAGMYCWRWWCARSSQGPGLGMEAMA